MELTKELIADLKKKRFANLPCLIIEGKVWVVLPDHPRFTLSKKQASTVFGGNWHWKSIDNLEGALLYEGILKNGSWRQ